MIFFCYKTQINYNILQKTNRIRHWTPRSTVAKKQADFAGFFFLQYIVSIMHTDEKNIWYTNCHYAVQNTSPMLNLRHWMFAYKGSSSFIIFQREKKIQPEVTQRQKGEESTWGRAPIKTIVKLTCSD